MKYENYIKGKLLTGLSNLQDKYKDQPNTENVNMHANWDIEHIFRKELWSSSQICKHYGFSRQRLYAIVTRNDVPGQIIIADQVMYLTEFTLPWMDAYVERNGGKHV